MHLKYIIRHLWKNKLYSLINVFGLSVGITCMLFAVLYWKEEHSYDQFHQNNPNLYRITTTLKKDKSGERVTVGATGQVQGPAFKAAVPEMQEYTRLLGGDIFSDVLGNNKALHLQTTFTDENFFSVFSFDVLKGNPQTALKDISAVVLTESVARRFFNSIDVIGKSLSLDADPSAQKLGRPMQVTAVVKDPPVNSSIRFDVLMPMKFMQLSFEDDSWLNAYLGTFVVLHPAANTQQVIRKMNNVYQSQAGGQLTESIKQFSFNPEIQYGLQPVTEMHLHPLRQSDSNIENAVVGSSSPVFSYLFMGIAFFILLMAAINFVNISIAGSLKRAKEVGVRKITGGSRLQIILQFIGESAALCLLAYAVAICLVYQLLPLFNQLAGKQLLFSGMFNVQLSVVLVLLFTVIVLLTSLYPAYHMSRFKPTEVLYKKQKLTGKNILGKSLVVIQFSLTLFLLIGTMVYYQQMLFIQVKNLGYNPHETIRTSIAGNRELVPIIRAMRQSVANEASIKQITFGGGESSYDVKLGDKKITAVHKVIDEQFLPLLQIPLLTGRNLAPVTYPSDSTNAVIVNEAFVKAAGLQHPLGTVINTDVYFDKVPKTIIGVIKDYHFTSLREPVQPLVMFMNNWYGGGIWVKLENHNLAMGLAAFQQIYARHVPGAVYSYQFLDEANNLQYQQEQRWQKIITVAAIFAIIISCLGLFGLAHMAAQQRIKEIGIRKVLGATVMQVLVLLSSLFLRLVMIAFIIAAPLAWLVMNHWLRDFAYRIHIGPGIFIVAALFAIIIAFVGVGFQAIKAALSNPVNSLRNE